MPHEKTIYITTIYALQKYAPLFALYLNCFISDILRVGKLQDDSLGFKL